MKMNGTFSYSLYEKVKNFSFVVNENGKYKMHESIKDIIIANTPEILRTKYQKILQENENSKLENIVEAEERKAEDLKELGYNIFERNSKSDIYKIENSKQFFIYENNLYIIYAYGNDLLTSEMDIVII